MTPRQESNVERTLGRLEAQFESIATTLDRLDQRSQYRDETMSEIAVRVASVEDKLQVLAAIEKEFGTFKQVWRDGKMQGRGIMMGIALSAGAGGAAAATAFKTIYAWVTT